MLRSSECAVWGVDAAWVCCWEADLGRVEVALDCRADCEGAGCVVCDCCAGSEGKGVAETATMALVLSRSM